MRAVKVTLPRDLKSVKIYTFADWHIGDKACDINAIKSEIQAIKDSKESYVICNGDLMNNAKKHRYLIAMQNSYHLWSSYKPCASC